MANEQRWNHVREGVIHGILHKVSTQWTYIKLTRPSWPFQAGDIARYHTAHLTEMRK